jgi:hypothetical protein
VNERIKELAKQAGEEIKAEYEDERRRNRRLYNEIFLPKFAELIVAECMRMCEVAQVGYLTHGLEKEASGAFSVKQYIEEYLGVES